MRRYLKRNIKELLETIVQMHELLSAAGFKGYHDCLPGLQEAAIAIGGFLESSGENEDIIRALEKYCEDVYQYSIAEDMPHKQEIFKEMEIRIKLIHDKIENEIKEDKLEILFMPYKADMWTSLASIWEAATKDSDCRVKVMPIPYYDIGDVKNIRFLYEGDRFPKDIEITDYNNYSIEENHPDIILIHNPYDGSNNLTRVPKYYYSSNIKNHTGMLIYSPYFTVGGFNPKSQGFMFETPGVLHADYVIAQSEKVKQLFVEYGKPSNQVLACGSPKIDNIIKNLKKQQEVPLEWQDKIKGRKVFLLNTHLSYLPKAYLYAGSEDNYGVRFHKEILDVFINKKDCALIWRPHPLLKSMLQARFPECLPFVNYFEETVREADNGIVDETGDYNTAFYCSDALLSTWSSLINEYMVTEKPVLIFQKKISEELAEKAPLNRNINYFRLGQDRITFEEFRDNVLNGLDPLYDTRMKAVWDAFPNKEGMAGEEIYQYLKNTF